MEPERETDGGVDVRIDQTELYDVVHAAVRDALLDILGTVLLLGFALLFVAMGVQVLFIASSMGGATVGVGIFLLGFVLAAAALDIRP